MKKIILTTLGTLVFISSAQASFFVTSCSTASGDTTHVSGHSWETTITVRSYEPVYSKVQVDVTNKNPIFEQLSEPVMINSYSTNKCGMTEWGSTTVVKAKLSLEGEAFGDSVGGAKDGVIEDYFICEEYGNSMAVYDPNDPDCN